MSAGPEAPIMSVQNTLALLPMLAITMLSGEVQTLMALKWKMGGIMALLASCVGGLGMSYFSFALRAVISATSFSVIGNVCKVLTILVNLLMWDKHSSEPLSCSHLPRSLPPLCPHQGHPHAFSFEDLSSTSVTLLCS